jgi:tRNA 2-selenouridine synthase
MSVQKYIHTDNLSNKVVIDLRNPEEFQKGHISSALNHPLFTPFEYKTILKTGYQNPKSQQIVANAASNLINFLAKLPQTEEPVLVCRDGGWQSQLARELLRPNLNTLIFKGGYKAYRKWVVRQFTKPFSIVVISGKTGSGKSELLNILSNDSELQTIRLGLIANHRGSVFGSIQGLSQPTQDNFENAIANILFLLNPEKPLITEYEQANLGGLHIPLPILERIKSSPKLELTPSREIRITRIVSTYGDLSHQNLRKGIENLAPRLGNDIVEELDLALQKNDVRKIAEMLMNYYDHTPGYNNRVHTLYTISNPNLHEVAHEIQDYIKRKTPPLGWRHC